jgi:hypothetical protein
MAPAVFAATMAMVLGARSLIHAKGGFDVPTGVNPVTQLHQEEMVLPVQYANVIRDLAGSGNGGGAVHLHVAAVDAASVKKLFMDHGPALADSLRRQRRNFSSLS